MTNDERARRERLIAYHREYEQSRIAYQREIQQMSEVNKKFYRLAEEGQSSERDDKEADDDCEDT